MPTEITNVNAVEKSTFIITIAFTDDDGNSVAPATMVWSLVDTNGEVINDRDQVEITDPDNREDIVLTGDDLVITESRSQVPRWLVFEGTYNSDAGNGLYLKDQVKFYIDNLKKVI